jgi:Plasmid pRiA4b ORF-3-like protein
MADGEPNRTGARSAMATPPEIVRLKISLDDLKPTVMRRIEVPVDVKLDTLHEMIQVIMPWDNYHPYEFRIRDRHWRIPCPEIDDYYEIDVRDARKTPLARVLAEPNFKALRYTYDFGDDWQHTIKVERRFSAEQWDVFPRLIDAKGRCPPEDIGGTWGYATYLAEISDPHHPRHSEPIKWPGRRDPNEIDRPAMEAALARFVKSPRRTPRRAAKPRTV